VTTVGVLGSTGSIGTQTLEVIAAAGGRFEVAALAAHRSVDRWAAQVERWRPRLAVIGDESRYAEAKRRVPAGVELLAGEEGYEAAAAVADVCVNGVTGFAGLGVTMAALRAGKRLALANKESLIAAGPVVQPLRAVPGAELIPVDSEHCAIHQCLAGRADVPAGAAGRAGLAEVAALVLTASGGPFRGRSLEELRGVTVAEALAHPTWAMGPKITVDSSTLMNKGLEVIEAHVLFGVDYDRIEVVVQPQSVIHSMVTFVDGSTIAQLSLPDMRLPIGYALAYPDRLDHPFGAVDWARLGSLDFAMPDRATFRCLDLAYKAGRAGQTAPAWLNAANEVAVAAFLDGRLDWPGIAEVLADVLDDWEGTPATSADVVIDVDRAGRLRAARAVEQRSAAHGKR
jgi:1-deoxy-D-xylulose-5-phosphate reductoisomerase